MNVCSYADSCEAKVENVNKKNHQNKVDCTPRYCRCSAYPGHLLIACEHGVALGHNKKIKRGQDNPDILCCIICNFWVLTHQAVNTSYKNHGNAEHEIDTSA